MGGKTAARVAGGGGWLGAEEVAVVAGFLVRGAEGGVGFGDLDEALGGGRVVGVEVRVVGFGEFVELSVSVASALLRESLV